jgi:chromate transporter
MNLWLYFWLFLKASLFSTGGVGNLPFLHTDLPPLGWAREEDFITAIAVGQVSPGPNGLWSVSLGYLTFGWLGALLALLALCIPPLLVMGLMAFYNRMEHLSAVQNFSRGLSLGVVGLAFYIAYSLSRSAVGDWAGGLIALGALGLGMVKRVPVVIVLILAAGVGVLVYGF